MKKKIFAFTLIFMVILYVVSVIPVVYLASETYLSYEDYAEGVVLNDARESCKKASEWVDKGTMTAQEAAEYIVNARDYSATYGVSAKEYVAVSVIILDKNGKQLSSSDNRGSKNTIAFREFDKNLDVFLSRYIGKEERLVGFRSEEFSMGGEKYYCVTACVENGVVLAFTSKPFCANFIGLTVIYILMGVLLYFRSVSLYNKKDKDKLLKETNGAVL